MVNQCVGYHLRTMCTCKCMQAMDVREVCRLPASWGYIPTSWERCSNSYEANVCTPNPIFIVSAYYMHSYRNHTAAASRTYSGTWVFDLSLCVWLVDLHGPKPESYRSVLSNISIIYICSKLPGVNTENTDVLSPFLEKRFECTFGRWSGKSRILSSIICFLHTVDAK